MIKKYKCPQCGRKKFAITVPMCKGKKDPNHALFHIFSYRMEETNE